MELRQLRHFIAVAETLNFGRAAEAVHIAQPALSVSIQRLERELGTKLFERKTRMVRLTEAGKLALTHARRALASTGEMQRVAGEASSGHAGSLRIGFVGGATYRILPRVLALFRREYPQVALTLGDSTTHGVLGMIRDGKIDAGLVYTPLAEATDGRLFPLERDALAVVVPKGHRLARRRRVALADLADEAFIGFAREEAPSMAALIQLACQRAGFLPRVAQEAVQLQTIVSLVRSGLGIALIPSAAAAQHGTTVEFRKVADASRDLDIAISCILPRDSESQAAEHFLLALLRVSDAGAAPSRPRRAGHAAARPATGPHVDRP